MKGIIVGVDESPYSQAALRWAVGYGGDRDLPVTAVMAWDYVLQHHVAQDAPFDAAYGSETAAKVLAEVVRDAVDAVGEGRNGLAQVVIRDRAGPALLHAAGDDASLIVVGARGMSGFKGLLIGSVSRYVLHAASVPVAVIRRDPTRVDAPLVVGIDGSESSRRALEWAVEYARSQERPLIALHAWIPPYNPMGLWAPPDIHKQAQAADRFLDSQLARVDESGLVGRIERRVKEQRPSAALLEASGLASMIVVGSRGRRPVSNTLLGSVSDQVSHYATCPVVVVP
jgi:nucleotide-binding universal stress UspA family protein